MMDKAVERAASLEDFREMLLQGGERERQVASEMGDQDKRIRAMFAELGALLRRYSDAVSESEDVLRTYLTEDRFEPMREKGTP
jgi:hypothetical protein